MRYAARDVWAQFELLLLQQRVLFIKPAAHTTQAKLRMVVPKQLVEQSATKRKKVVLCDPNFKAAQFCCKQTKTCFR